MNNLVIEISQLACLTNTEAKIDDSDTEEADETNIIDNKKFYRAFSRQANRLTLNVPVLQGHPKGE